MELNAKQVTDSQNQDEPQTRIRLFNPWGGRAIVLVILVMTVTLFWLAWNPE